MRFRESLFFMIADIFDSDFYGKIRKEKRKTSSIPKNIQTQRFIETYKYVILNVDFYKKKYKEAGLTIDSIREYGDIVKIPCLTKDELAKNNITAKRKHPLVALASGGTSGRMVNTLLDKPYLIKRYMMLLSILYTSGWRLGDPTAALHPLEYGYFNNLFSMIKGNKINKIIFDFFQQYILYGFFHNLKNIYYGKCLFEENNANKYLLQLFNKSPKLLRARPDVLNVLIKQAKLSGYKFNEIEIILVVGNILTEMARKNVERVFNAKVYNLYASTELGYVGVSCSYSGVHVHIDEENYLLEIDIEQDNEIIVTDFNNYVMPMIRYRTSDVGEFINEDCVCGKGERLLRIRGRRERYVLNENGAKIYESDIMEFFEKISAIWAYQLRRETAGIIRILVRPKEIGKQFIEEVLDVFCKNFKIERRRVFYDIDTLLIKTASGKLCIII